MPSLASLLALFLTLALLPQRLSGEATLPILPPDQLSQWPAIGRVNRANFSNTGFCTGTLVAPDIVLTAAHCAPTTREVPLNERRIFVAGWLRDQNAGYRQITGGLRHPAYATGGKHSPRFDIGLLFLDRPFEDIAPLPVSTFPDAPGPLALIGYHRRRPFALSGRLDCPIRHLSTVTALLDCPVVSGNSGSPILSRSPEGAWQVVAVTSSQAGTSAIAARLGAWVLEQLPPSP